MYDEENTFLNQIAAANRYALRQAAVNLLNTEFLPPESAKEKRVERWMKISLAHLTDGVSETLTIPTIFFPDEITKILMEKPSDSLEPVFYALLGNQNLNKISSEKCFTEQNRLLLNNLEQYSAKDSKEKLTKLDIELSEQEVADLMKLNENFLKLIREATIQNNVFILNCKSIGISEKKINEFHKEYSELLNSELKESIQNTINLCLFKEEIGTLPELPETPTKPIDPKMTENNGCDAGMFFSDPLQPKPFSINTSPNNMLAEANNLSGNSHETPGEENKESIKFTGIR